MEQKEYSYYVIPKIIERFPQFKNLCTLKPNNVVDVDYKSNQGKLTFRLTTQDKEMTIGFACDDGFAWHIHMNQFGANTPDEELQVAINLIDNIINDKIIIGHSTVLGYYISDSVDKYKEKNEIFTNFYWSEL